MRHEYWDVSMLKYILKLTVMHQFKKLKIWQKSMELALKIYKVTDRFPVEEKFGLSQQIRRSAVSVPSNISEGAGRRSEKEFSHFLNVAYGSSCELETQLILAYKIGFINNHTCEILCKEINEIQKMTFAINKTKPDDQ